MHWYWFSALLVLEVSYIEWAGPFTSYVLKFKAKHNLIANALNMHTFAQTTNEKLQLKTSSEQWYGIVLDGPWTMVL